MKAHSLLRPEQFSYEKRQSLYRYLDGAREFRSEVGTKQMCMTGFRILGATATGPFRSPRLFFRHTFTEPVPFLPMWI
ncbi:MAG: hypothetical protein EOM22_11660 [Gammaproteobacteria bacterium]|nr:hypothetical protein [Gammaproteobacteria bacterium]